MATTTLDEESEDKLVEMWKGFPCLFDVSSKAFSNRNARRVAVETMAASLDKSADDITKKMKSPRTQFTRMMKIPASGSGRKAATVHQLWMTKNLEFLRPHLKARDTSSSLQLSQDEDEDDETTLSSDGEVNDSLVEAPSPVTSTELGSVHISTDKHAGPSRRKQIKKANDNSKLLETIAKSLETPVALPEADHDDVFGSYVASSLRKMSDPRIKAHLTYKINQAISEAEFMCLGMPNTSGPEHSANYPTQGSSGMGFFQDQYRSYQNL